MVAATNSDGSAAETENAVAVATAPNTSAPTEIAATTDIEATSPPAAPPAAPEVSTEIDLTNAVEGAVDHTLTAELSMDADVEPAPTAMLFPKTLKAILAEGAVRPTTESIASGTELSSTESTTPPPETTSKEATELPESTPLPHATAMESGGVRPQTSALPRLPMSNLPGELAQQIHLMQQEGTRTMRLRLQPENLGELQIEIQGTGDAMKVRLVSANPVVRDALESQMGDLKDAMQKQGLALDQATVDGEPNRRGLPQEQERRPTTTFYRDTPTSTEQPEINLRPSAPVASGPGALNVLA
jgi:flagellar hook-length control protein FliK